MAEFFFRNSAFFVAIITATAYYGDVGENEHQKREPTMKAKKVTILTTHEKRCRFNSGYHDASLAVREGWATPKNNFGFGSALKVLHPDDVVKQHFSRLYAEGWIRGFNDTVEGRYTGDSTEAWKSYVRTGKVACS